MIENICTGSDTVLCLNIKEYFRYFGWGHLVFVGSHAAKWHAKPTILCTCLMSMLHGACSHCSFARTLRLQCRDPNLNMERYTSRQYIAAEVEGDVEGEAVDEGRRFPALSGRRLLGSSECEEMHDEEAETAMWRFTTLLAALHCARLPLSILQTASSESART